MNLDIDMDGDEDSSDELGRPLIRDNVLFDANEQPPQQRPANMTPMPRAAQAVQDRDERDMWAELG